MKLKKSVKIFLLLFIIIGLGITIFINSNNKETSSKQLTTKEIIKSKCKSIKYCKNEYIDRYVKYYNKFKDLTVKDVVTRVNLNLDYSFYTHTKKTNNLNTTYLLVNKYLYLGSNYVPNNLEDIDERFARSGMKLVDVARDAFVDMAKNALKDDIKIVAMSSYRSYDYQVDLYNDYVSNDGVKMADTYSARAGYSEHQTGLCVDIYDGVTDYTNFEDTDAFKWMKNNAYKYGFILRFPKEKEDITGYQYESWHYRYIGKKIAKYIYKNNITLEEYYIENID